MSSASLTKWFEVRAIALNQIEAAHRGVGGAARGRRFATQQINHAYAMLLSSQFQGFCRDLHSECLDALIQHCGVPRLGPVLRLGLEQGRKLDHGNPNRGNIGSDFNRFAFVFWDTVRNANRSVVRWQNHLDELVVWRNAIAHQDFAALGSSVVRLDRVRLWRRSCDRLAKVFAQTMRGQIFGLVGVHPW